jgi:predicted ATPase
MRLSGFSSKSYRNVAVTDLAPGQVNLLIGPNNSGKTNLIDAMSFPAALLVGENGQATLADAVQRRGGPDIVDRHSGPQDEVQLSWVLSQPDHDPLRYELHFRTGRYESFPNELRVSRERLLYDKPATPDYKQGFVFFDCHVPKPGKGTFKFTKVSGGPAKPLTLDIDPRDTVFHQLKSLLENKEFRADLYPYFENAAEAIRSLFLGFRAYSSSDFDRQRIAEGADLDLSVRVLDRAGRQFTNVLRYLDQRVPLEDFYTPRLRELIPGLKHVKFVDVTESRRQLRLYVGEHSFGLREMSDGTLKALLLALLLGSPERTSVLAIDEPELNLHPAWLRVIAGWVQRSTAAEQIFLATHSPDLLDAFTEGFVHGDAQVFVFGTGGEAIRRLRPEHVQSGLEAGWELGDLYRQGEPMLGGWPW